MGLKRTDEFRQDAVRIALTSGLTRKQVAVLSDQFELVSARTVRLILMPRRVGAIRQERRRG